MVTRTLRTTSRTGNSLTSSSRTTTASAGSRALSASTALLNSPPGAMALEAARSVEKNVRRAASGMLGLSGERMSKVDTAWLRMDCPSNLMLINGVWVVSPGITLAQLRQRAAQRLSQYPRFLQRVVEDAAGATWVNDHDFDIDAHVQPLVLVRKRGQSQQQALAEAVGHLATEPLDGRRPLWQFHLVEDFVGDDGQPGSALIVRIHHCIGDGIALISVVMSMVDGGSEPPRRKRREPADAEDWLSDALIKPLAGLTVRAIDMAGEGAVRSLHALMDPETAVQHGLAGSADAARMAWRVMNDAAALALMPDDSPTRLKGEAGTAKRVAWCPPLPLDAVKGVGKALGCSINDVLLSCVAGAIGSYLRSLGDDTTGKEIRAMIPVNLRPMEEAWKLGNHFGLAPLVLPIGIENPIERIFEVRHRMAALKGSTQPLLAFGLLAVAGMMVKPAQEALLNLFGRKTTAVMTNVPGPREALMLCGSQVTQCMFWVPQTGNVGLGVSILSYGGGVQFGVITDTQLCPEPQRIIDAFAPEFETLATLTLMLPWGSDE
ncbi:wax ester/triacylglycerol synthase family O-acyltransferase [Simplicispira suum]|uniref:wax ester/triacylglycerol synthase family O-acyltransferase n=1 Tax=Simplicispira suum TaxID=2109915 RepID=UPI0030811BD7